MSNGPVTAPRGGWARLRKSRMAAVGGGIVFAVAAMAATAPQIFPFDPLDSVGRPLTPPFETWRHPLGTDRLGRDIAAWIFHGARVSLAVGIAAALLAVGFGGLVGAIAGYRGGWIDEAAMRLVEAFQTVPGFVLALALVSVLGPSTAGVTVAVAAISWTQAARIVRAEFMSIARRDYVRAARALGASDATIMLRHILPNALPPTIALATVAVAAAILVESALAFLGLGDPGTASWGGLIGAGRALLRTAWYVAAAPGIAIAVAVLGVALLGEGISEAFDPRNPTLR